MLGSRYTVVVARQRESKDRYIDFRVTLVGGGRGRQMALVLGQAKSQGAMDGR